MVPPRPLQQVLAMALGLLLLVGCGSPAATPTPIPGLEPGWILYEEPGEGFAIGLPPSWEKIDLESALIEESIETIVESNPELAPLLTEEVRSLAASGAKFVAFDLAPEAVRTGPTTSLAIVKVSIGREIALDDYLQASVEQLERLPNVVPPISHRRVELLAGEALELKYNLRLMIPGGEQLVATYTQYLLVRGKDAYGVTLNTLQDQAQGYSAIFEKIARSFRWL